MIPALLLGHSRTSRGFSIVEVVVGAGIVALIVTGIASAWQLYVRLASSSVRSAQAALLTEEGGEALQYLRDKGWSSNIASLSAGTTYHLYWTGSDYAATTTPELINGAYYRTITRASVARDPSTQNIVASGGTTDANTYLITMTIYPGSMSATPILSSQMLIHNIFSN